MAFGDPHHEHDPSAPWVPPDPPRPPAADRAAPPAATDELPVLPPVGEAGAPRRRLDTGRLTTVVLAAVAAVALAAFGCLGAVSLLINLPDQGYGGDPVTQQQPTDTAAGPDEEQSVVAPPSPDPTPSRRPASTPSTGPGRFAVAYAVTGQGPADILYRDADGYLVQLENVPLPWHRTIRTDDPSQALLQGAKAHDQGGRTITCALTINGGRPVTESVGPAGWRCGCFGW
ncbi:MmpS family transport accessory protein [Micromonospora sp. NPDC007271]|uniref:MmpS family transport accessory protein n=1 Tax=Micromonospora sp. NPDC007271 TaxID=3154587 RepID=UPI0033F37F21